MDLLQFYGLDWIATICGLAAVYFLGNKNKFGFVLFIVSSLCWISFGVITGSLAVIIGSAIFVILHIRGLWYWRKQTEVIRQEV